MQFVLTFLAAGCAVQDDSGVAGQAKAAGLEPGQVELLIRTPDRNGMYGFNTVSIPLDSPYTSAEDLCEDWSLDDNDRIMSLRGGMRYHTCGSSSPFTLTPGDGVIVVVSEDFGAAPSMVVTVQGTHDPDATIDLSGGVMRLVSVPSGFDGSSLQDICADIGDNAQQVMMLDAVSGTIYRHDCGPPTGLPFQPGKAYVIDAAADIIWTPTVCVSYADADGDGYGDPDSPVYDCDPTPGTTVDGATDCDDTDPSVHPGGFSIDLAYRVPITFVSQRDIDGRVPVLLDVDFGSLLGDLGESGSLDPDSIRAAIPGDCEATELAAQFLDNANGLLTQSYAPDAESDEQGSVVIVYEGVVGAGETAAIDLYFDVSGADLPSPPAGDLTFSWEEPYGVTKVGMATGSGNEKVEISLIESNGGAVSARLPSIGSTAATQVQEAGNGPYVYQPFGFTRPDIDGGAYDWDVTIRRATQYTELATGPAVAGVETCGNVSCNDDRCDIDICQRTWMFSGLPMAVLEVWHRANQDFLICYPDCDEPTWEADALMQAFRFETFGDYSTATIDNDGVSIDISDTISGTSAGVTIAYLNEGLIARDPAVRNVSGDPSVFLSSHDSSVGDYAINSGETYFDNISVALVPHEGEGRVEVPLPAWGELSGPAEAR